VTLPGFDPRAELYARHLYARHITQYSVLSIHTKISEFVSEIT